LFSTSASNNNEQFPDTSSTTEISPSSSISLHPDLPTRVSQRIPCKARGIKGKHDASNAYIEIPPDVQHGTVLTCSNTQCIMTGRLFQFCIVCQLPVSKANFLKRHAHEGNPYLDPIAAKMKKKSLHHLMSKIGTIPQQPEPQRISSSPSSTTMSALLPPLDEKVLPSEIHRQQSNNRTNNYYKRGGQYCNDMKPPKCRRLTSIIEGSEDNSISSSISSSNKNNNGAMNNNLGYSPWSFKKSSFTNGPVMTSILQPNNYGNNAATTSSSITPLKLIISF